MAVCKIRTGNDPVLHRRCMHVQTVGSRVRDALRDMTDTLHATTNGAAIAAPQIGLPLRLVVIDFDGKFYQLVNPRIVRASGAQECVEGCLSLPGKFGVTVRPSRVKVEALDENGKPVTLYARGDMAKCLCHEIDHLDGRVFWEHVEKWLENA